MNRVMNHKEIYYYPKSSRCMHKAVIRYPHYRRVSRKKFEIAGRVDIYDNRGRVVLSRSKITTAELKAIEQNIKAVGTVVYTTEME